MISSSSIAAGDFVTWGFSPGKGAASHHKYHWYDRHLQSSNLASIFVHSYVKDL
jgi:hypothetical protein